MQAFDYVKDHPIDDDQALAVKTVEWNQWPKELTADYLALGADGSWQAFWDCKPECVEGVWYVYWGNDDIPKGATYDYFSPGKLEYDRHLAGVDKVPSFLFNPPDISGPALIANPHKAKVKQPSEQSASEPSISPSEKGTFMSTVTQLKIANTNAALAAAKSRAGKLVMKRIVKFAKPKMPNGYKEFADSSLFQVLAANLFAAAIINYLPTDARAKFASEALLEAAAGNLIDDLAIAEFLDGLLDGISVPRAAKE